MNLEMLPVTKPFAEAVAFQRRRRPVSDAVARKLEADAAMRSWWISGLAKQDLVTEAHRLATEAIEAGRTKAEFLEDLGKVLDQQDGLLLSPRRLELIAQNSVAVAYSAGRYAQMSDPEVTELRPYRQYPLGPHDARTSKVCLALEGLVARWDHPIWRSITPPNHHNERHLQVLTLTEEQAKESGKLYEGSDEDAFPFVESYGGRVMPDPGWNFEPELLGFDDRAAADAAFAVTTPAGAVRTAAELGLERFEEVDLAALPREPERSGSTWEDFARAFAIPEGSDGTLYPTPLGSWRISREFFDHIGAERAWLAPMIRTTLDDPFEAWALVDATGRSEIRVFGLFAGESGGKALQVVGKLHDNGWSTWTAYRNSDPKNLEAKRLGRLVATKARRKG